MVSILKSFFALWLAAWTLTSVSVAATAPSYVTPVDVALKGLVAGIELWESNLSNPTLTNLAQLQGRYIDYHYIPIPPNIPATNFFKLLNGTNVKVPGQWGGTVQIVAVRDLEDNRWPGVLQRPIVWRRQDGALDYRLFDQAEVVRWFVEAGEELPFEGVVQIHFTERQLLKIRGEMPTNNQPSGDGGKTKEKRKPSPRISSDLQQDSTDSGKKSEVLANSASEMSKLWPTLAVLVGLGTIAFLLVRASKRSRKP